MEDTTKRLFEYDADEKVHESRSGATLSPYLMFGSSTVITNRSKPLSEAPEIGIGNKPIDGGYYLFTGPEKAAFVEAEPEAEKYFKRWLGAEEFINGTERWCLWLGDCPPQELRHMPLAERCIDNVRRYRLGEIPPKGKEPKDKDKRVNEGTIDLAATPTRFHVEFIPKTNYLVIPEVSSEHRRYIPIGFLGPEVLSSNKLRLMPSATPYHFGILTSAMHMAWINVVTGRLESRYQYSVKLVYNNFPWPTPSEAQKTYVEQAAKEVLASRQPYLNAGASFSDLYDPGRMPHDLVKAHQLLDRTVDRCYRPTPFDSDRDRVEDLFGLYETLTKPLAVTPKMRVRKRTVA